MKGEPVMRIQESGEMYLETILLLSQKSGHVRAIDVGEEMGWNIDRGLIDIHFSAQLAENDQPCLVIDHLNPPKYGFMNMR